MKKFTLSLMCLFFVVASFAQQKRNCLSMENLEYRKNLDPSLQHKMDQIEVHTQKRILDKQNYQGKVDGNIITIPVVVHVIYSNTNENISDAQIQSQIDVLNEDFRRTNSDADNKWSQAADTQIEFALATVDPNGNTTTGITRKSSSTTAWGTNDAMKRSSQGGVDPWDSSEYLNMWVCNIGSGLLGYAQFPGGSAATDGVVMGPNYFGSSDKGSGFYLSSPFDKGRTTTHEVGHFLNLRHIWGDGACGVDDFVTDTPSSDAANYGCASTHTSCGSLDMVENYMDYSDDSCMNLFTAGQTTRMRTVLEAGGSRRALALSDKFGGGTTTPTCSDGIQNGDETGVDCGGSSCAPCSTACTDNEVTISITFDNYPEETSWSLTNSSGQTVASDSYSSSNADGSTVTEDLCLPDGCYTFTINDAYGDGICCSYGNGSFSVTDSSSVLASGGSFGSTESNEICVGDGGTNPTPTDCDALNFNQYTLNSFATQDSAGNSAISGGGANLTLTNNTWKYIDFDYTVTANTVIEFEFSSTSEGEIHGVGFEDDNSLTSSRYFKVYGTQNYGVTNYDNYSSGTTTYVIPVGDSYTGSMDRLVFINDNDAGSGNTSTFSNVKIYETSCSTSRNVVTFGARLDVLGDEDEGLLSQLSIAPNPVQRGSLLKVLSPLGKDLSDTKYSVINMLGQVLDQGTLDQGSLSTNDLKAGVYILNVSNKFTNTSKQFIIK